MPSPLERMFEDRAGARASRADWPRIARTEILAGLIACLVTLAHCLSYSALVFSGPLADGIALGVWGFLAGTTIGCLATAFASTLPPALAGPRNPTVAVMSVLAVTVAGATASAGGTAQTAVAHVLLALALSTLLTGIAMAVIGQRRLGQAVRFVPYPVVAGFLAASGWLLVVGGVRVALGRPLDMATIATLSAGDLLRVGLALAFMALLLVLRARGFGGAALPLLFVAAAGLVNLALLRAPDAATWFLATSSRTIAWTPLTLLGDATLDWRFVAAGYVEILSVVGVAAMSLMLDASTLEAQRRASADVDREFRAAGFANVAAAAVGGFGVALAPNASRLIDELGGRYRLAGIAGGLAIGGALVSGIDLARLIPTPVLGGLLAYLGATVLADALLKPPARPAPAEALLALVIAGAIVALGYLGGIVLGLVGACILFALRYSRIDAVRHHLTRADLVSPIDRDPATMQRLREDGHRIHVFWLTGFIFFGSANRICDQIRALVPPAPDGQRRWVILDVAGVNGLDAAAILSFTKLCSWADTAGVTLVLAAAAPELRAEFARAGLSANDVTRIPSFPGRNEALEHCESDLLRQSEPATRMDSREIISQWLETELGKYAAERLLAGYLEPRTLAAGDVLCQQGDASQSVEFVATGSVAVLVRDGNGRQRRVRRMLGRTIVGEMGFIRRVVRAATVVAEAPTVVFVLERSGYEALSRDHPELARALIEFIARTLADRLEFTNREAAALA